MRTKRALCLPLLCAASLSLLPRAAHAQDSGAQEGEFSVQRFEPAPGTNNFLTVERLRMDGAWGWSAGLAFDYARNPFVVKSCVSQTDCSAPGANSQDTVVIRDMFTWNLLAAVSPIKRLQIGLRVPMAYVSGDGIDITDGSGLDGGFTAFGVGDPMIEGKVRLVGEANDPFTIGLAGDVSFPLGTLTASTDQNKAYIGNDSPVTGGVRAIFDGEVGPLFFGANLRGVFRQPGTLGSTTVGPVDFRYAAALGFKVSPVFRVMAETFGGTQFSTMNGTNTLEVDGAIEIRPVDLGLSFRAGGGAGVLQGVGVPAARALAMITYAREVSDKDGDEIYDDKDACPTLPEDKDGFEDSDGCPDEDNDGDKVPDSKDKCPDKPETINGLDDEDGCPDTVPDQDKDGIPDADDKCPDKAGKLRTKDFYGCPDTDEDGVADTVDKCPDQAEDTDGYEDTDGCPDEDNDKDGIKDELDECIDQPEVVNGFKDEDGCPDEPPDQDKDGIPDATDKCPTKPENYNGYQDEDGCPDKGPSLVQVGEGEIKILQRVEFATGKDKIEGAVSFKVLDAVVGALKGHPEIFLVEVAGHTDDKGSTEENRKLSQKRAEAVVAYLTSNGIEAKRLQAKGYGPDKPIADNKQTAGRKKNRRVEFTILKSTKTNAASNAPQQ